MTERSPDPRELKVLYCIEDNRCGGPHRRAHAIARRLREYHAETFFLLGYKGGRSWCPAGFESFVCRHLQCFTRHHALWNFVAFCGLLPANLLRIRRFIRSHDIDIVHADGITNFVPALAAGLTRTPLVWHYNDHPPQPLKGLLLRLVRRLTRAVIVQGQKLKEERTRSDPKLRDKTVVLYPGIDLQEFDPTRYPPLARAGLRQELGIPAAGPLVGIIGNLNPLKGHTYFIQAAQRVKEKVADAKFLVVGRELNTNPDYAVQMRRLAARCGLKDDLIFAGFREDGAAILSLLDVFVLSSIRESCPNVVLEAMAMGVPVVATDVGAVSEIVVHGQTGWIVPPRDAEAIATAVVTCLILPNERVRDMGAAARKRIADSFEAGIITRQQYQVYERVLGRGHMRGTRKP
jgi:glycosyltransferase involved in cell wall biosynthesis